MAPRPSLRKRAPWRGASLPLVMADAHYDAAATADESDDAPQVEARRVAWASTTIKAFSGTSRDVCADRIADAAHQGAHARVWRASVRCGAHGGRAAPPPPSCATTASACATTTATSCTRRPVPFAFVAWQGGACSYVTMATRARTRHNGLTGAFMQLIVVLSALNLSVCMRASVNGRSRRSRSQLFDRTIDHLGVRRVLPFWFETMIYVLPITLAFISFELMIVMWWSVLDGTTRNARRCHWRRVVFWTLMGITFVTGIVADSLRVILIAMGFSPLLAHGVANAIVGGQALFAMATVVFAGTLFLRLIWRSFKFVPDADSVLARRRKALLRIATVLLAVYIFFSLAVAVSVGVPLTAGGGFGFWARHQFWRSLQLANDCTGLLFWALTLARKRELDREERRELAARTAKSAESGASANTGDSAAELAAAGT